MPPLGLLLGKVDFGSLFDVLDSSKGIPMSLQDAKAKVFRSLLMGTFINDIITLLFIAFVIFLLIRTINNMKKPQADPIVKDCPYCLSTIPVKAIRRAHCTADLKAA
jgi:large conductance mechanosensitive channel